MIFMHDIPVVFENEEIFLINKPAGISVQGGEGIAHPLDEEFSKQVGFKIHLVHRLDKETAGLMLVAKNGKAASKWIDLISSKQVRKEYDAICFGLPLLKGKESESGVISGSVTKKNGAFAREQSALTNFRVEKVKKILLPEESAGKVLTLSRIHLKLGTGRMHQIRIHLASVKSPICGDDKHGDFKLNKLAKKRIGIKKLLLCSSKITLPLSSQESKTFSIDLPEYFSFFDEIPD